MFLLFAAVLYILPCCDYLGWWWGSNGQWWW